jgi:hypothetical protein
MRSVALNVASLRFVLYASPHWTAPLRHLLKEQRHDRKHSLRVAARCVHPRAGALDNVCRRRSQDDLPGVPTPVAMCQRSLRAAWRGRTVGRSCDSRIGPSPHLRAGSAPFARRAQRLPSPRPQSRPDFRLSVSARKYEGSGAALSGTVAYGEVRSRGLVLWTSKPEQVS